jgi:hypothetical protein
VTRISAISKIVTRFEVLFRVPDHVSNNIGTLAKNLPVPDLTGSNYTVEEVQVLL